MGNVTVTNPSFPIPVVYPYAVVFDGCELFYRKAEVNGTEGKNELFFVSRDESLKAHFTHPLEIQKWFLVVLERDNKLVAELAFEPLTAQAILLVDSDLFIEPYEIVQGINRDGKREFKTLTIQSPKTERSERLGVCGLTAEQQIAREEYIPNVLAPLLSELRNLCFGFFPDLKGDSSSPVSSQPAFPPALSLLAAEVDGGQK